MSKRITLTDTEIKYILDRMDLDLKMAAVGGGMGRDILVLERLYKLKEKLGNGDE